MGNGKKPPMHKAKRQPASKRKATKEQAWHRTAWDWLKGLRPIWLIIGVVSTLLALPRTLSQIFGFTDILDGVRGETAQASFLLLGLSLLVGILVVPRAHHLLVGRGIEARNATRIVAVASIVFLCVGTYAALKSTPVIQGSTDEGSPIEVDDIPPSLAQDCELITDKSEFSDGLKKATAVINCEPTGAGATEVWFSSFSSTVAFNDYVTEWRNYLREAHGPCQGATGYTRWADSAGRDQGLLMCDVADNQSFLVWTDEDDRVLASAEASSSSEETLYQWWVRRARPQSNYPTRSEKELLATIRDSISTETCKREQDRAAVAVASVYCDSPRRPGHGPLGADGLTAALFESEGALTTYFADYYALFGQRTPSDEKCPESSLASQDWRYGGLLCFPGNGSEWLGWTDERKRVFGEVWREDENQHRLYEAWGNLSF